MFDHFAADYYVIGRVYWHLVKTFEIGQIKIFCPGIFDYVKASLVEINAGQLFGNLFELKV